MIQLPKCLDDGECLSIRWMVYLGFVETPGLPKWYERGLLTFHADDMEIRVCGNPMPHIKTRGDLRLLCVVLGTYRGT